MKVLVIHPEDELRGGPWGSERWDRVVDIGRSGAESYAEAASSFGCSVTLLDSLREGFREQRKVRDFLALGMGRMLDGCGLDWWELTSIEVHQELEVAFLLSEFVKTLGPLDEVYVSRPCFHAEVLRLTIGARLHIYSCQQDRRKRGARHYLRVLQKFPVSQLLEIFWDKTDPGYQFRGSFGTAQKGAPGPVVLLPTAYVNVSRTAVAYAESLPETHFLLVATRRSGWVENTPPNVSMTWLRRYASVRDRSRELECKDLLGKWNSLRNDLRAVPEFRVLEELGCLNDFPDRFATGLEIRDAWRNVFERERVQSVLCADDSNSSTHIPLLLARQKGLPTISCHHGALDGHRMFKRNHADVVLAKGRMEEDYLVRLCGISSDTVEVGAPMRAISAKQTDVEGRKPFVVFFSESYDVVGGRTQDFYRDVLPALATLALAENRELIVKLHPAESLVERKELVKRVLQPEQQRITRVIGGPLQDEMLNQTWFGVTVLSTVAVECTLRGIPCFLCGWLEAWPYGYVDQFSRFGVGIRLQNPGEIQQIPARLRNYRAHGAAQENCWSPIEAKRLQALLGIGQSQAEPVARR